MAKKNEPTERSCAVTRDVLPVDDLLRFVLAPDNTVVVDVKGTLPGRGVWVTATREKVEEAIKKRVFARGFKEQVTAEEGLADQVEKVLEQKALGALSISRKAGELVTGFTKTESALRSGGVLALLHATDASDDGVKKLAAIAASMNTNGGTRAVLRLFTSAQMNLALGRDNVIHAALLAGQAGRNCLNQAQRLARFRGTSNQSDVAGSKGAVAQD
ncbi:MULTISPECIES: RNA-binding protein [Pseudovibrio]|uniref:RNA-binding protein n=1 Tax=Stappiaceae TaxID=2821832 RepID=UPI002366204F|nr:MULTISPECIES: RNA-binding protein [Pseudovibrio]MDD7909684.1 RNA-binding protein [Pseudovibrio exalbescens]MDX5592026.1 RNA-binding protein [Pseudovibrio sp. SPO723]